MIINNTKVNIKRYSSKEMKLLHSDFEKFLSAQSIDIFYNNQEVSFFELLIFINYFSSFNKKINLTLGYLPYQRMNQFGSNQVATLQHFANLLNNYNLNSLVVCEPHCNLELFKNAKAFSSVTTLYHKLLQDNPNLKPAQLVFTDKGGTERYSHLSNNFLYGQKTRNSQTGLIEDYQLIGKAISNTFVVVDDIISTGDTLLSAIELLEKANAKHIYIVSGHLEKNIYNKRISTHPLVEKVYTSNSLTKKTKNTKIKIFSLWGLLNEK